MKKGYYITSKGKKVILKSEKIINVSNMDIIELVLPDGVLWVSCEHNKLETLILPDGIKTVWCDYGLFDYTPYLNKDINITLH